MLLRKLDWIAAGCQRNMYMTNAQLRLAKAGHALAYILSLASGVIRCDSLCVPGSTDIFAIASITRAKMYITI